MRDDREFLRIDVSIPCLISCDDRVITGDIINLSLSGAFIQASETLAEGSPVVLMLVTVTCGVRLTSLLQEYPLPL